MTIGQEWKKHRQTMAKADAWAEQQTMQEEARQAIAKIPALVAKAQEDREGCIRAMPRSLEGADTACGNIHHLVHDLEGRRALAAEDLAGAARLIYDWCAENDLACNIARAFGGSFALIALPK